MCNTQQLAVIAMRQLLMTRPNSNSSLRAKSRRKQFCASCFVLLSVPFALRVAPAQTASEMPIAPSRAMVLPLSGSSHNGNVDIRQRTLSGNTHSTSVDVFDSMIGISGSLRGSVVLGRSSSGLLEMKLDQALSMGLRTNLGALEQSAIESQAKGQQTIARSELLPQLYAVASEAFEKENFRTIGISLSNIPTTSTFNYYDARAVRLSQSVVDFVKFHNLQRSKQVVDFQVKAARNTRDLIVLAVAGSYLQLTATKARLEATRVDAIRAQVHLCHLFIYRKTIDFSSIEV